jgi:hypothetical protein
MGDPPVEHCNCTVGGAGRRAREVRAGSTSTTSAISAAENHQSRLLPRDLLSVDRKEVEGLRLIVRGGPV